MSKSTPGDMPGARQSNVIVERGGATQDSEATTATGKRQKLADAYIGGSSVNHKRCRRAKRFCVAADPRTAARPIPAMLAACRLEPEGPQAARSSSRTIDSPITAVDTLALPSCMMSAVRRPPASTRAIASSSRSAAAPWSNE
jgi:hypothetical protein